MGQFVYVVLLIRAAVHLRKYLKCSSLNAGRHILSFYLAPATCRICRVVALHHYSEMVSSRRPFAPESWEYIVSGSNINTLWLITKSIINDDFWTSIALPSINPIFRQNTIIVYTQQWQMWGRKLLGRKLLGHFGEKNPLFVRNVVIWLIFDAGKLPYRVGML